MKRSGKNEFGTVIVRRLLPLPLLSRGRAAEPPQLSRRNWPTDKWEKIVQFEAVVSSRRAALQINERLPQVWQEIFPSIPGRAVRSAASPPPLLRSDRPDTEAEVTLRRRRRRSCRPPYFYSPPLAAAASSPLACFFFLFFPPSLFLIPT